MSAQTPPCMLQAFMGRAGCRCTMHHRGVAPRDAIDTWRNKLGAFFGCRACCVLRACDATIHSTRDYSSLVSLELLLLQSSLARRRGCAWPDHLIGRHRSWGQQPRSSSSVPSLTMGTGTWHNLNESTSYELSCVCYATSM